MKFDNKKSQFKFEEMKDHVELKIRSYIKNEYDQFFDDPKNNFPSKIDEITNQILFNLENWISEEIPERYKKIILTEIYDENWSEIIEAFKQEITFGTSGIRGKLVVSLDEEKSNKDLQSLNDYKFESSILRGSNSINEITIMKNICGLANYLSKKNLSKIIIGYDSRILSKSYSKLIASIFLKKNFSVILFENTNTLPELSFAVTYFAADLGIEITASHNDKRYNGIKLISKFGSPPSADTREEISEEIINNRENFPYELLLNNNQIKIFGSADNLSIIKQSHLLQNEYDKLHNSYLKQIENMIINKNILEKFSSDISIGYSATHGTGYYSASKLFNKLNIKNVKYVSKMISPEPMFPLFDTKQILDPSDHNAASVVVDAFINQYSQQEFDNLDVLCYTDPDADRLGIILKVPEKEKSIYGNWKLLKSNDVWTLFLWYILQFDSKNNVNSNQLFIVKNFVTSDSLLYLSKKFNIECIDGKVGFSDLTEIVRNKWKDNKINIGMFEESCGFGIAGSDNHVGKSHILEKDGLLSLAFIVEILAYAKSKNMHLQEILDLIYLDKDIGFS